MTDKELLQKINGLKSIKPDSAWKSRQREILLSQITGGQAPERASFWEVAEELSPFKISNFLSKPVLVVASIILALGAGVFASVRAADKTKPGDSLYIAKIVSEKTQLALTFDNKAKAKLNLEFAGNRAEEITQVLAADDQQETETVKSLADNFKKEIKAAKSNLAKAVVAGDKKTGAQNPPDGDVGFSGAILDKNGDRLEVSDPISGADKATTTGENRAAGSKLNTTEESLDEAEKLFDQKDYSGSLAKIDEANKSIDKPTEAKPAGTPVASTTPETKTDTATSTK